MGGAPMAETKRVIINLTSNTMEDSNNMVPIGYNNMSDFVKEAMKLFIEEKKKLEIIEKMKKGYKEMGCINSKLSEIGLGQDNLELALYEASLKRCDLL